MLLILYTEVSEVFRSFVNKMPNGIGDNDISIMHCVPATVAPKPLQSHKS